MIDLRVTGCEQPEQSREEIARLLEEYDGLGAVCLLRDGSVMQILSRPSYNLVFYGHPGERPGLHLTRGDVDHEGRCDMSYRQLDIIRVYPPGTRLRVTVEVVE